MISQPVSRSRTTFAAGSLERQFALVFAVTVIADWLFFGYALGISGVVFAFVVCGACVAANRLAAARDVATACLILAAGVAPLVEAASWLSLAFSLSACAVFVLLVTGNRGADLEDWMRKAFKILAANVFRIVPDILLLRKLARRSRGIAQKAQEANRWLVPLGFGAVFAVLFIAANPVFETLLFRFETASFWEAISIYRIIFWVIISSVTWPLIRVRMLKQRSRRSLQEFDQVASGPEREGAEAVPPSRAVLPRPLFNTVAVFRSLLLFNLLFAIQTALDAVYLWGGAELPEGMTYADYAHRGAYTLIAAAMLSAVFMLSALRPGSESERHRTIRLLFYVWVAQNVALVAGAALRLELYVEVYALTHWRIAAFIWMGLVAAGLALILGRLVFGRSNAWLIAANAGVAASVLYVCAFLNFTHIIAVYNVDHSREVTGKGVSLDLAYFNRLGSATVPALDIYAERLRARGRHLPHAAATMRTALMARHLDAFHLSWRVWTFRGWRLARYLEAGQLATLDSGQPVRNPHK